MQKWARETTIEILIPRKAAEEAEVRGVALTIGTIETEVEIEIAVETAAGVLPAVIPAVAAAGARAMTPSRALRKASEVNQLMIEIAVGGIVAMIGMTMAMAAAVVMDVITMTTMAVAEGMIGMTGSSRKEIREKAGAKV